MGAYTLTSRATDKVGNVETPERARCVYVDSQHATITFHAVAGLVGPAASESEAAVWTVSLTGASADPPIRRQPARRAAWGTITVPSFDRNAEAATLLDTQHAAGIRHRALVGALSAQRRQTDGRI